MSMYRDGLYLQVTASGARSWVYRYSFAVARGRTFHAFPIWARRKLGDMTSPHITDVEIFHPSAIQHDLASFGVLKS